MAGKIAETTLGAERVSLRDLLDDRDVLIRFERGTRCRVFSPHLYDGPYEIADPRQRPLLSEHVEVFRLGTELEGHVARGIFEHDAVIPAHFGTQYFDRTELAGCAAKCPLVEDCLHTVEIHFVLKEDTHLVQHAAHDQDVMIFLKSTAHHHPAIQRKILIHAGFFLKLPETLLWLAVDRDIDRAVNERTEPAAQSAIIPRIRIPCFDSSPDEILGRIENRIRVTRAPIRERSPPRPEHRTTIDFPIRFPFLVVAGPIYTIDDIHPAIDSEKVFTAPHDLSFALVSELKDARWITSETDIVGLLEHQIAVSLFDTDRQIVRLVVIRFSERLHVTIDDSRKKKVPIDEFAILGCIWVHCNLLRSVVGKELAFR